MSFDDLLAGNNVESLRQLNDKLNESVVEQMVDTQELVMMNSFAHDSNEYLFKKSLQQRISDISSWRWILVDLAKRLEESIEALQHEHNALRVVIRRIDDELNIYSRQGALTTLGALADSVEDAIIQEQNFLRNEKNKFEKMLTELEKQIINVEKTKKRIELDILKKQQTLDIEDACANIDSGSILTNRKKKKRRSSPLSRWENRCDSLKKAGLKSLRNAIITRQQVRGARIQISIAAQGYAAKVDSILKRRLHANQLKFQDLCWQREEAIKDFNVLEEELTTTEQNLLENLEQERLIETRITDRSQRPVGELTKDDVDRKLRDELGRLRNFTNELRKNRSRITTLQNHITNCISRIECCSEDLNQVINLDEERMKLRNGEIQGEPSEENVKGIQPSGTIAKRSQMRSNEILTAITEEDEDDYPFND
ncbi:uncharacterized protein LOC105841802 [Bombyx mori]|uniref:Tektin n=1 Tax=Bombyx mori TaxID=7091 RepID=A0A8R2DLR6_BOMMO|nr:uncharacterized protein LOC105841802 [Bombyx mori]